MAQSQQPDPGSGGTAARTPRPRTGGRGAGGRDQRVPMERLVRMAAVLQANGEQGVSGSRLAEIAGFEGADPGTQVQRELRHLERHGWSIENVAPRGEPAVYRLTTVDNRLRVRLTTAQQAALRRAVLLADRGDLVQRLGLPDSARPADVTDPAASSSSAGGAAGAAVAGVVPEALGQVVDAVRDRSLLRFAYKGTPRVVHPESVSSRAGVWYLRGVEDADLAAADRGPDGCPEAGEVVVKTFVVSRMSDTEVGTPGTASPAPAVRHAGLHPMTWEIDPPVEVTLATSAEFEPDVRRWLGEPLSVEPAPATDTETDAEAGEPSSTVWLRYRVTHRAALRSRLFDLGRRVRIVGPADVRDEVLDALRAAVQVRSAQ
ncbi:WYL domain-containing protein [Nocardioides sp. zg-536]|uniref:WYL domain-containing protein n=1 Tax=Nocardioides faecalis TaxID=2803858 RepID=A0A939BTL6_9ACTN|nr:WYL domain-containing protein [Nocardioides faecalis]MBM9460779.1 WYL domain-containing protein [Nocardioides faecalis]QVI57972.1 WYL domain-containing protein [Nocardioides faecalis]